MTLLAELGEKPDALLLSRERFTAHENVSQGGLTLDGSENASVQFASCCRPVPGDPIVGYLGRGEGLVVHTDRLRGRQAPAAQGQRALHRRRVVRRAGAAFETGVLVTVANGKGALARVAAALANAEADITHVDMDDERAQDATDLRFVVSVRDRAPGVGAAQPEAHAVGDADPAARGSGPAEVA
jgi:guanosine-3',5'-bis(diphosphate) 3'-pyrophosphohydrolase